MKTTRVKFQEWIDRNDELVEAVGNHIIKIGLVSLFNGISTFVCYLMPKPFSEKNSRGTI